jgi:hypothetical protein
MHVLLMTFDEEAQAQAALTTLGTAGIGPISAIPGVGFNGDGHGRRCLHAFCFLTDAVSIEAVLDLLMRTVGPPAGPFARWVVLRGTDVRFPDAAAVFAEAA